MTIAVMKASVSIAALAWTNDLSGKSLFSNEDMQLDIQDCPRITGFLFAGQGDGNSAQIPKTELAFGSREF